MAIKPKDRSMICRMAGNIAGATYMTFSGHDAPEKAAKAAVATAVAIIEEVDSLFSDAQPSE